MAQDISVDVATDNLYSGEVRKVLAVVVEMDADHKMTPDERKASVA